MAAWKKVLCGECQGTGKVFPHKGGVETCPGCDGKGEILRDIEDIEREEALLPVWCNFKNSADGSICAYAKPPYDLCETCLFCKGKLFNERKSNREAKADAGKPRPTLVPVSLIEAVASIREYGVKKYHDPDNWKKVEPQRYKDAAFRHWLAYIKGEKLDPESGLPHLHHCACNLAFLIEMEK